VKIEPINVHIRSGGCPTLLEILIIILFVLFPVLVLAYNFRYIIEKKCFLRRVLSRVGLGKRKSQKQVENGELKKTLSSIKTSLDGNNDTPIDFSKQSISPNEEPNSQGRTQEEVAGQINLEIKNVLNQIDTNFSTTKEPDNSKKSNLNLGPSEYQLNKKIVKSPTSPPLQPPQQFPPLNNTRKNEIDKENSEWKNEIDQENEFTRNKSIKSKQAGKNQSKISVKSKMASIFGKAVNQSSKSESVLCKNKKLQGIKSSHLKTNLESIDGGLSNTNSNNSSRSSMHLSESQYDITSNHMYEYKSKDLPSNPSSVTEWSTEDSKVMPIAKASSISNEKAINFRDAENEKRLNVNLIFGPKGSKSGTSQTNLTVITFLF